MRDEYAVVDVFPTVQGEGVNTGRRAVFLRFAGCNLWNGLPGDRGRGPGACSQWCDTMFTGGVRVGARNLVRRLVEAWGDPSTLGRGHGVALVVATGGEPTLQLDPTLVRAIQGAGFQLAVETNGTRDAECLKEADHVCVSPKLMAHGMPELAVTRAHELKVVLPGVAPWSGAPGWTDEMLVDLETRGVWGALYVQPQDVTDPSTVEVGALSVRRDGGAHSLGYETAERHFAAHVDRCLAFVSRRPRWRLGVQAHKLIGAR